MYPLCSFALTCLCPQVKSKFRVGWVDPADPTKGFKYLYLTPTDHAVLAANGSVIASPATAPAPAGAGAGGVTGSPDGHCVISDIIGAGADLGVENLKGSATIAGEVCGLCSACIFVLV